MLRGAMKIAINRLFAIEIEELRSTLRRQYDLYEPEKIKPKEHVCIGVALRCR